MNELSFMEKLLDGVKVEWLPLGEVTQYEQPTKYLVKTKNYSDKFHTPVLTAGKTFILGYTNETNGIYKASVNPVIIFDDFTTANKWVDFDFKAKSSAMKMITSNNDSKFSIKYVYYWLSTLPNELIDGDHKRQWISNYTNKMVPIPSPDNPKKSLEIQAEIVRILDAFTAMTTELTAELNLRKKQYNYYRDQLLSFEEGEVEWKTLGEMCLIGDGLHGTPIYDDNGDYFFINGNNLDNGRIIFTERTKKVNALMFEKHGIEFDVDKTVFLSINGTIGSVAFYGNENIVLGKSVAFFKIQSKALSLRYLFYFLQTDFSKNYFELNKTGSTIKNLGLKALRAFNIPVPPLSEQARIVTILDKFDDLTTSITEGLPREIELRQKQYEYYRDLLLSFPQPQTDHQGGMQ